MGFFSALFGRGKRNNIAAMLKEGAYIVDVRSKKEYSMAYAKGTVNIPLDQLNAQLNKIKNKKNIVLCCASGARSGQAEQILKQKGFENVVNAGSLRAGNRMIKNT